jgi:hypothetical protein
VEPFTIVTDDQVATVSAETDGARVLLDPNDLDAGTGWELKPEGLCRGEVCVPTSLWPELVDGDRDRVDLAVFARLTGQVVAIDLDERVAVLGPGASTRAEALSTLRAPDFTVHTIDDEAVSLADFRGRKKLLVAFASW